MEEAEREGKRAGRGELGPVLRVRLKKRKEM